MFSILWHPSQWPDLQQSHQFWALVIGLGVIIFVIGMWMHYHVRHTKLTEDGKRDQSNMVELASQHESHHIWPRFLRGMVALTFVATAIIGNFVMYVVNGKQALHHKQTVTAQKMLQSILGTAVTLTNVNTSTKTLEGTISFNANGKSLTCTVRRSWKTTDYNDPSKYKVGNTTSVLLNVTYSDSTWDVTDMRCPDVQPAQALGSK